MTLVPIIFKHRWVHVDVPTCLRVQVTFPYAIHTRSHVFVKWVGYYLKGLADYDSSLSRSFAVDLPSLSLSEHITGIIYFQLKVSGLGWMLRWLHLSWQVLNCVILRQFCWPNLSWYKTAFLSICDCFWLFAHECSEFVCEYACSFTFSFCDAK